MPHDSISQAIAGSSSVGSPWKVTVSVPPLTGWPWAAAVEPPPPESLEPPQAASPMARASSATSTTAVHLVLFPLMSCLL